MKGFSFVSQITNASRDKEYGVIALAILLSDI